MIKEIHVRVSEISCCDANEREREFLSKINLFKKNKKYNPEEVRKIFPNGEYFEIKQREGWIGLDGDTLLVIHRGTDSLFDWFRNLLVFFRSVVPYKESGVSKDKKVHSGFFKSYLDCRKDVTKKINKHLNDGIKKVLFFGFSKGGAMAALNSLDVKYHNPNVRVYLFVQACPKIGNGDFMQSLQNRVDGIVSMSNTDDIVPSLPFFRGYKSFDKTIYIKGYENGGLLKNHNWNHYHSELVSLYEFIKKRGNVDENYNQ